VISPWSSCSPRLCWIHYDHDQVDRVFKSLSKVQIFTLFSQLRGYTSTRQNKHPNVSSTNEMHANDKKLTQSITQKVVY